MSNPDSHPLVPPPPNEPPGGTEVAAGSVASLGAPLGTALGGDRSGADGDVAPAADEVAVPTHPGPGPSQFSPSSTSQVSPADSSPNHLSLGDSSPPDSSPNDSSPNNFSPSDFNPSDSGLRESNPSDSGPSDLGPGNFSPSQVSPADRSAGDFSPTSSSPSAPADATAAWPPPPAPPTPPQAASAENDDDAFPGEVEMTLVDHLEELRRRLLRSLLVLVIAAAGCLLAVKPLVRWLEVPARGIRFLQLAPGEFLFVSLKVAGYAGLVLALPWILFEGLAFVLPGLTRRERRLVAPAVAGSTLLFLAGLAFAWWALVPAALRFLVSYGADVVEPLWSIERYLDFVLLLMVATALAFQLPVLQLLLGALGLLDAPRMLAAWRWVVLLSALAGAVLTPSTDPVTMLLLSAAITALYLIGVGLVALVARPRLDWA